MSINNVSSSSWIPSKETIEKCNKQLGKKHAFSNYATEGKIITKEEARDFFDKHNIKCLGDIYGAIGYNIKQIR